jgi:hypothetical protein
MCHFRRHANALAQRRVRVNGLANIDGICAHLDRQRDFTDHVAGVGADHAAAQNLAIAMRLFAVVKQQLGDAFVAAIGNGAAGCRSGELTFLDLDALHFTGDHFCRHMRLMHGLVCQHELAQIGITNNLGLNLHVSICCPPRKFHDHNHN